MGIDDKGRKRGRTLRIVRQGCAAVAVASFLGGVGNAHAFDIPTGNEEVKIHWDNTLRYTLGQRIRGQNKDIMNSPQNNDGDSNFNVGLVTSRLDLLSEADVVYKKIYGVRLSGAAWYDPIYTSSLDGKNNPFPNHLDSNGKPTPGLSSTTKDRFGGPNGELLDAFAFAKFDAGDVPISVRVGRHTVYWGESFFAYGGTNGISYGQSPIDMAKAFAMPGVELKEIFRPLNQVSVTTQPTKTLSIAAQYYLQWEPNVFPEGGSYLGFADPYTEGGESLWTPGGPIRKGGDVTPRQVGDYGVSARWTPEWLDGTLGFYYRNFSDKLPQMFVDVSNGAPNYRFAYGSNIDLYGISLAKQVLGVSVGAELSYRTNMPLASTAGFVVGAPGTPGFPGKGDTPGARGDTMHAVVNFLSLLPKTPLFDTGSTLVEFTYGRWNRVTQGGNLFLGSNAYNGDGGATRSYNGMDRVTRDNATVAVNFAPQWFQVMPGVDLTMPLNFGMGLFGTSAVTGGGVKDNGNYSAGLSFDIFAKYKVDLTYASYFGTFHTDANGMIPTPGAAVGQQNTGAADAYALLKDRDLLSLTFKATF